MVEESSQLITFSLADEEFGIEILNIKEIIRMVPVTRVPRAPEFIEGVVNLRGQIIPIVDLRKRMGFPGAERTQQCRIIVIMIAQQLVGFVVDSVAQVLRLDKKSIEPPPPVVARISTEYIRGVGKLDDRLIILLNFDKLISTQDQQALQKLSS